MELEKIRAVDTTVRWQDDEDIEQCPNCKSSFTVTRRKVCLKKIYLKKFANVLLFLFAATLPSLWHRVL